MTFHLELKPRVVVAAVLAACQQASSSVAPTAAPSSLRLGNDLAALQVAATRCEVEEACAAVGPGSRYETRDACMRKMARYADEDFGSRECALGIDSRELDICIVELRRHGCGSPGALIGLPACGAPVVCAHGPE